MYEALLILAGFAGGALTMFVVMVVWEFRDSDKQREGEQ